MVPKEQNFSVMRFFSPLTTVKAITLICILGLIVYGNALFNGFVWDDLIFIINNPDVHSINIAHLFGGNLFNSSGYYRPIPALYFAVLYTVFGSHAFFYHFLQISLHILNTSLVYLVLRTILGRDNTKKAEEVKEIDWQTLSRRQKKKYKRISRAAVKTLVIPDVKTNILSLFLSLIFLVHPIQVESVSYIAASQSELFFFLRHACVIGKSQRNGGCKAIIPRVQSHTLIAFNKRNRVSFSAHDRIVSISFQQKEAT